MAGGRRRSSSTHFSDLKRYDFGAGVGFCCISQCGNPTRNRGCALCHQVFCKACYQAHCIGTHGDKLHMLSEVRGRKNSRSSDVQEMIWRWTDVGYYKKELVDLNPVHWSKPWTKAELELDLRHHERKEARNKQRSLYIRAVWDAKLEKEFSSPVEAILWVESGCSFRAEASVVEDDVEDQRISLSPYVGALRQQAIDLFLKHLTSIDGKKKLDLCNNTIAWLDLLGVSEPMLRACNCEMGKSTDLRHGDHTMVFVMRRPDMATLEKTINVIRKNQYGGRRYTIIFISSLSRQCRNFLKDSSVNVTTKELPLHLIPFDDDVLSMEMLGVFKDFHLERDESFADHTAEAMFELQQTFGVIDRVHTIGEAGQFAKIALNCDSLLNDREGVFLPSRSISEVIFIDRKVDLYSVCIQPYTYEALIDQFIGLRGNIVQASKVHASKLRTYSVEDFPKADILLNPTIPFYRELRHLHFDDVKERVLSLIDSVRNIQALHHKTEGMTEMDNALTELKSLTPLVRDAIKDPARMHNTIKICDFVQKVMTASDYKSQLKLESDIMAGESQAAFTVIKQRIKDQMPFHEVLRWLLLYCLVENSNVPEFNDMKKIVNECYNDDYLKTLCNVKKLLVETLKPKRPSWSCADKKYNLRVEEPASKTDISYAYGGIAPLSVRLVEKTKNIQSEWHMDETSLCELPGEPMQNDLDSAPSEPSIVLVCYLGGVTYGEIAALRRLSEKEKNRRKFLIVTTEILNSEKFFNHLAR